MIQPGGGLHVDPASVDKNLISTFTIQAAQKHSFVEFLLGVVPANPVGPFLDNNILQVLIIALMFGFGITRLGPNKDALVASLVNVALNYNHLSLNRLPVDFSTMLPWTPACGF